MGIERSSPRAHLVVDDFFSPAALEAIFDEIAKLDREMKPGLVRDIGHDGQSIFFENPRRQNQAVWIHDPSKTLSLFRERFWSTDMQADFDQAREPLFQIIPNCWSPNLQVSRYMTGDHYDFHEDEGAGVNLTVIVFLAKAPKKIRGGDLVLAYGGQETTIRFRHNRLVVFPSKTLHRVTRVHVDSKDARDARISLQSWLTYGRPEREPDARPPEADRPTFLLAEAPIIGAAQALIDSTTAHSPAGRATERTAEELYWGAFYLSRVLTQNVNWLGAECGLELGPIRIRRGESGLEVYGRGSWQGAPIRAGFVLQGSPAEPSEAVSLFVEGGGTGPKGARGPKKRQERRLPPMASEKSTIQLFQRLLKGT